MANNRLYLGWQDPLNKKGEGYCVCLGKRMAWGWYGAEERAGKYITELFNFIENELSCAEINQDSFVILLESVSGEAPHALEEGKHWKKILESEYEEDEALPKGEEVKIIKFRLLTPSSR